MRQPIKSGSASPQIANHESAHSPRELNLSSRKLPFFVTLCGSDKSCYCPPLTFPSRTVIKVGKHWLCHKCGQKNRFEEPTCRYRSTKGPCSPPALKPRSARLHWTGLWRMTQLRKSKRKNWPTIEKRALPHTRSGSTTPLLVEGSFPEWNHMHIA